MTDHSMITPSHALPGLDHYVAVTVDLVESGRVRETIAVRVSHLPDLLAEFPNAVVGRGLILVADPIAELRRQIAAHAPKPRPTDD